MGDLQNFLNDESKNDNEETALLNLGDISDNLTSMNVDDKKWTNEQEIILKRWAEIAKAYAWMHHRSFFNYRWQNFWFSIPVIILSNLTGIANFAQSSDERLKQILKITLWV